MKKEGILEDLDKPFLAEMAIVVYSNGKDYYLESHKVTIKRNRPLFGPGIPLLEETLSNVIGSISKEFVQFHDKIEIMPPNVLINCQTPGKMNVICTL